MTTDPRYEPEESFEWAVWDGEDDYYPCETQAEAEEECIASTDRVVVSRRVLRFPWSGGGTT